MKRYVRSSFDINFKLKGFYKNAELFDAGVYGEEDDPKFQEWVDQEYAALEDKFPGKDPETIPVALVYIGFVAHGFFIIGKDEYYEMTSGPQGDLKFYKLDQNLLTNYGCHDSIEDVLDIMNDGAHEIGAISMTY